jgi:cysteine sulfinate desulfinase/cysteine desulfurase-like protein
MSGHKLYGPKGVGALYMKKGVILDRLIHGGNQENGLRAGTENVMGIAGLGKAAELALRRLPEMDRVRQLRNRLEKGLLEVMKGSKLNGHKMKRLPNTLNIYLPGLRGESMVLAMDQRGVAYSSGSACRSGSPKPSQALLAMGLTEEEAHCSVRLSLGICNTTEEIDRTINIFYAVTKEMSSSVRFMPCR